jgi:mRNA interferase MazF
LANSDFETGGLKEESWVRPNKIFTFESSLIGKSAGHLNPQKMTEIIGSIIKILRQ